MSLELKASGGAGRGTTLRAELRRRDVTQRFDDAITSVGQNIPESSWSRFATGLVRLLPPLLFLLRVSGQVPLIGQQ